MASKGKKSVTVETILQIDDKFQQFHTKQKREKRGSLRDLKKTIFHSPEKQKKISDFIDAFVVCSLCHFLSLYVLHFIWRLLFSFAAKK